VNQNQFQSWFSRIAARKSILLYDTCESGSLTGERVAQRGIERVAALEKMTRAMGRTVLSASTDDEPALEGYKGHGVFTYALLDAIRRADANGDGLIDMIELAGHIDRQVPELSVQAFKRRQVPQMTLVGSNFPLATRTAVLADSSSAPATLPLKPTHVVIAPVLVRDTPNPSSTTAAHARRPDRADRGGRWLGTDCTRWQEAGLRRGKYSRKIAIAFDVTRPPTLSWPPPRWSDVPMGQGVPPTGPPSKCAEHAVRRYAPCPSRRGLKRP
jgi:hypothetical protein